MRVLHIDTGPGWRGGQQQVFWLMQGLRQHGLEQALAAPRGSPLAKKMRSQGFEVMELRAQPISWANLRLIRQQTATFDILHAHDAHAHTLAWISHWGRKAGQPKGRPWLVISRRVAFSLGLLARPKYAAADAFVAVSEFVRQRLLEAGVAGSKIRVVRDGVQPPACKTGSSHRAEFRSAQGVSEEAFLIGTLTSLAPEKMPEAALDLLAEMPSSVHFWLGHTATPTQEAENALLQSARQRGLENRFRILSLGEDAHAFLDSLDLFVYLSRLEGLGSAILLAMAHGLPVVASEVGGIPEIVRHQQTGLLVRGDPPQELTAAVRLLLGAPDLRQRLANAGREFVLTHATDAIMVAQTAALYRDLISQSGPRSQ
ncbi:MAG: glycosyltransferase family 4 protein [Acidobacteria bacterium]|nr:glycosyltransferase family 4 protein [Acidobacteriota bacterium]